MGLADAPKKAFDRLLADAFASAVAIIVILGSASLLMYGLGYYLLPDAEQALDYRDPLLRSSTGLGLWLGFAAAGLIALNVVYLVRRNLPVNLRFVGSPRSWLTVHVVTGLSAPLVALMHSGFHPRTALGVLALCFLTTASLAGIVGRYLYSVVPRGSSGRELEVAQVRAQARELTQALDHDVESDTPTARLIHSILEEDDVRSGGWIGARVFYVVLDGLKRWRRMVRARKATTKGAPERALVDMAGALLKLRLQSAQHEEFHRLLSSWRGFHRWLALTTLLLLLGHVYIAVTYAGFAS